MSSAKCSAREEPLTEHNFERVLSCKSLIAGLIVHHVIASNADEDCCPRKLATFLLGALDLRVHVFRLQNKECYRLIGHTNLAQVTFNQHAMALLTIIDVFVTAPASSIFALHWRCLNGRNVASDLEDAIDDAVVAFIC